MLERNTDEMRMKIQSLFVKAHEFGENCRKNWIVLITGLQKSMDMT